MPVIWRFEITVTLQFGSLWCSDSSTRSLSIVIAEFLFGCGLGAVWLSKTVVSNHSFQNHYTHKIIIFKLFRSLQLQFLGPTGMNVRYSYSFVGLTGICLYSYSSVQLH